MVLVQTAKLFLLLRLFQRKMTFIFHGKVTRKTETQRLNKY